MFSKTLSRSMESARPSLGLYAKRPLHRSFHSPWDHVRPSFWHPASALEQSMMELERMSDMMRQSRFPFDVNERFFAIPSNAADDEFFRDLPVKASKQQQQGESPHHEEGAKPAEEADAKQAQATAGETPTTSQPRSSFSSYSFSSSSIVDDKGQRVTSTRRRYEDSAGRLKAVHERQLGDKKLRSEWQRQNAEDEGHHEAICSSGSVDEFEELWRTTPFGEAQEKTPVLEDAKGSD